MKTRKGKGLGRLAAGLLAAAFALPLHAGVGSSAVIDITNFTIGGSGFAFTTGQPVATADVDAALTGFSGSSLTGTATGSSLLDLATRCVGTCPQIGSNLFPVISGAPIANFSTSDQIRSGSLTTGARIANGAYTSIASGDRVASANSNNNLNGTFTVSTAGPVTLTFDARAYTESFVSRSEGFPGFSTAAYGVSFSILNLSTGGNTVFSWSPNGEETGGIFGGTENDDPFSLNTTVSLNAPVPSDTLNSGPHMAGAASSGRFQALTQALQPGQLYQLSARINTNADAQRVQVFSALGDRVWRDANANGIQDCTDTNGNGILGDAGDVGPECGNGVAGIRVTLTRCDGTFVSEQFTDANGFYLFNNLDAANDYIVRFDITATGLAFTALNQGGNPAADSDAIADGMNPNLGRTQCITNLQPGATDRTWDAGLVEPPLPVKLGDRLWEDYNGNGIQDCTDSNNNGILGDAGDMGDECGRGVPNATVNLRTPVNGLCTGPVLMTTTTDSEGFYLFGGAGNLFAGSYCVEFVPPADFCGPNVTPRFTLQNVGNDLADSDAFPASGRTGAVALAPGETNLTVDAGIFCPAKLGDRIWLDNNLDGNQNCSGVDPANPGQVIPNGGVTCDEPTFNNPVTVRLTDCAGNTATNIDGASVPSINATSGLYLFENLRPGANYCVEFARPTGYLCTTPNADMVGYQVNSDGVPDNGFCTTGPATLVSGGDDRSWDLGLVKPAPKCDLRVQKTCEVVTTVTSNWVCSEAKPLDVLTMTSAFDKPVKIKAWKGAVGSTLLATIDNIMPGQVISVAGYAGAPNDVIWEVFNAGSNTKIGESSFHLSCSDADMNGPEDCGKLEGNNKKNLASLLNKWLLEGLSGNGKTLSCTSSPSFPTAEACTATLQEPASCKTLGKPQELVFKYTGAGCAASNNLQGGKAVCTATGTLNDAVSVRAAGSSTLTKTVYTVNGSPVDVGGTFTITYGGSSLSANSYVELTDGNGDKELNAIHTSCSQPLAVGDSFGSLTLVGFNGQTGGTEVNYGYTVSNFGDPLTVTSIIDDKLGPVGATPFSLAKGASAQFTALGTVTETTTNTVEVMGTPLNNTTMCRASDSLTVTVAPPPPTPVSCSELKPIDGIKLEFDSALTSGKTIKGVQWYRTTVSDLNKPNAGDLVGSTGAIADGGVFNFTGFAAASATNDVDFIVTLSDNSKLRSRFHRSCSDTDMNDITDCGKLQGNGKDNKSGPNIWYLRDLSGNGKVLGCPAP